MKVTGVGWHDDEPDDRYEYRDEWRPENWGYDTDEYDDADNSGLANKPGRKRNKPKRRKGDDRC